MSGWQIGDLALCVDAGSVPVNGVPAGANKRLVEGRMYRVNGVHGYTGQREWEGALCLRLVGFEDRFNGFLASRFRKVRPDAHEACESEFVALLKRSKTAVSA